VVQATDLNSGQSERFVLLGAWDFDETQGSSATSRRWGRRCSTTRSATKWNLEVHAARHRHRIERIEAHKVPTTATSSEAAAPTSVPAA